MGSSIGSSIDWSRVFEAGAGDAEGSADGTEVDDAETDGSDGAAAGDNGGDGSSSVETPAPTPA